MKHVPLSAINLYLTLDPQEANNLELLALQAMERIKIAPILEHTADILPIENNIVKLPDDIVKIRQVALNLNPLTNFTQDDCCTESGDDTIDCTCCSNDENFAQHPVGLMEKQICRIRHQGVVYIYDYYALLNSPYYINNYAPMKMRSTPFSKRLHCNNCPNFYCNSDYTYEVLPNNTLLLDCEEGNVCLDYYRYATNDNNEYLIPDDPILHEAIASYVMWKHWEERWNRKNDGSERRLIYFKSKWITLSARYRGNVALESVDIETIDAIIYHNIKQARTLRVFNNKVWYESI
jgi:hypothetical protein